MSYGLSDKSALIKNLNRNLHFLAQESFYPYQLLASCKNIRCTYYTSAKGCFMDCSLRTEMRYPDSIYVLYIETFSTIGKQMEI